MKKDKVRQENVELDNTALKVFLDQKAYDGTDNDYAILERAYRSLTAELFAEFLQIFKSEGHNLEAKNLEGQTIKDVISEHAASAEYLEILAEVA